MATKTADITQIFSGQTEVAELLQQPLVDLTVLSLVLKQLHWSLHGTNFQRVHEFLDVIVDQARDASDEVAERIAQLSLVPCGTLEYLDETRIEAPPVDKFLTVDKAVRLGAQALVVTIETVREARAQVEELDRITEDMLISISKKLEKQLWMLRSNL